jgi:DNA-binding SARP family transcriptional activator
VEYRVLGPVQVHVDGQQAAMGGPTPRALLALLLLNADRVMGTFQIIEALWGGRPPTSGATRVYGVVSELRAAFGRAGVVPAPIGTHPHGYVLTVADGQLDLHAFERRLAEARAAAGRGEPAVAATAYRAALALWSGPALAGVTAPFANGEAARLEERRLVAVEELMEVELALGRHAGLVSELTALVARHPLRERLRERLMLVLYRSGRQAEALEVYQQGRQLLVDQLGLEPGPDLERLQRAILAADPELLEAGTRDDTGTREVEGARPPAQLPPDVADFTGRQEQAAWLRGALKPASPPTATTVAVLSGKPGVGKTALAVHAAHALRREFPDGQLYVDLRGAERRPLAPHDVLDRFLRALGVGGAAVPATLEERCNLYRSRLADRRVLVVLDNAADAAQVRPLLPATAGCAALLTSRGQLADLEGVVPLTLDLLPEPDAVALLAKLAGHERVDAEPEVAARIVARCGLLPLAVRIAGARLRTRPSWPLATMAARLADERRRLSELAVGNQAVRSSFLLSYRALGDPTARTFRLLGLLEAEDVAPGVVAAMTGNPAAEAELERLTDVHLLETHVPGRYRLHDLLRLFARERADAEEEAGQREAAVDRAMAWYLGATRRAVALLGSVGAAEADQEQPGPVFPDRPAALAWLDAELPNLVAAAQQAADGPTAGAHVAWQLSSAMWPFLHLRKSWSDWRVVCEAAIRATERTGEDAAAAAPLNSLGVVLAAQHRYQEAAACYRRSLAIRRRVGDLPGVARVLNNLGDLYLALQRHQEAVDYLEQSLACLGELGDRRSEGIVRNNLGRAWLADRRPGQALAHLTRSLADLRAAGDREAEAEALNSLGQVHTVEQRHQEAIACHRQSLAICRELGDRFQEAKALWGLGTAVEAVDGSPAARPHWAAALAILEGLDAPEAEDLRRLLATA